MAYLCELSTGQTIYLENRGNQTIVTTISQGAGQQQQASSGVQTGEWISAPQVFRTSHGVIIKINTASGEHFIQIQGSSMGIMSQSPSLSSSQQIQVQPTANTPTTSMPSMPSMQPMQPMTPMTPMTPMESMPPMKMGNMEMSINPMEMRMGNMEMKMGNQNASTTQKRFCPQCGAKVNPSDRFCASCGHKLQ